MNPMAQPVSRSHRQAESCAFCGHTDSTTFEVEERMIGLGERFHYSRCSGCGAMVLIDLPADLSRYYPTNYYSFQPIEPHRTLTGWRRWLAVTRNRAIVFGTGGLGGLLAKRRSCWQATEVARWLRHSPVQSFDARVLDVGCGAGTRLVRMHEIGYSHLTGIDPFISTSRSIAPGLVVRKQALSEVTDGPYDLIMLHHSLEHMPDHQAELSAIRDRLAPDGAALIRIPMAGNRLIDRYGTKWVEWDAPRHLVLHTEQSIRKAIESVGLVVHRIDWDSDRFAYWASELYERGLALVDPQTGAFRRPEDHFTAEELAKFDALAEEDNRLGRASRAAIWVQRNT